ncbi:MAG: PilZ domain-containing protein [Candidatus Omnitrophota bacterium]|nr:PilZ domain-containing protein [Candidatus Omnitrophota bacterium]MDZ4242317.1 PilZ domain-containing protein [Candidatus Omnitrophota bacterium]
MIQHHPSEDRRQHPRFESNIPLKICSDDADLVTETKNLSRTGVYCRVEKYIEPMTKLKIHLLLPIRKNGKVATKKVTCGGVIVRTESVSGHEGFNVAIYFNDINGRDSEYISEFIKTGMAAGASS